ncbi:hypothetical protein DSBG_3772 [Desulfosporosinus sp. BG]|nr:hypothetical protein DSBG_3772 [Desulfosporosinus sp. BG]
MNHNFSAKRNHSEGKRSQHDYLGSPPFLTQGSLPVERDVASPKALFGEN